MLATMRVIQKNSGLYLILVSKGLLHWEGQTVLLEQTLAVLQGKFEIIVI